MIVRYALFDFDGTVTSRDTTRYLLAELLRLRPWRVGSATGLLAAKLARLPARLQTEKYACIGKLVRGLSEAQLAVAVARFQHAVKPLFRDVVMEAMTDCSRTETRIAVVSASPSFAIRGLFEAPDVDVVATDYAVISGVYTGELSGLPCYGAAKVPAIKRILHSRPEPCEVVSAWSDCASDLPMMSLATHRTWIDTGRNALQQLEIGPKDRILRV